jgi:hypothetical protein
VEISTPYSCSHSPLARRMYHRCSQQARNHPGHLVTSRYLHWYIVRLGGPNATWRTVFVYVWSFATAAPQRAPRRPPWARPPRRCRRRLRQRRHSVLRLSSRERSRPPARRVDRQSRSPRPRRNPERSRDLPAGSPGQSRSRHRQGSNRQGGHLRRGPRAMAPWRSQRPALASCARPREVAHVADYRPAARDRRSRARADAREHAAIVTASSTLARRSPKGRERRPSAMLPAAHAPPDSPASAAGAPFAPSPATEAEQ